MQSIFPERKKQFLFKGVILIGLLKKKKNQSQSKKNSINSKKKPCKNAKYERAFYILAQMTNDVKHISCPYWPLI